ncbi:MAG: cytochrome c oxidase subunit II [Acidobacteriota bacterium]|nr:cytochrome c oxidase subunit II [Acidobacteriota bacterium]
MNGMAGIQAPLDGSRGGTMWLPEQASTVAPIVDMAFYFILGVSIFFTVLICGITILFLIKYRHRPGHEAEKTPSHSTALELTWSVIPAILVVMMFFYGFRGYMSMHTPMADAYEVLVTGQKWKWLFTYPNGYIDENLHIEAGRNVRLVMSSEDVIHSVWVPAFRIKQDVVPGRYNKLWFRTEMPGEYVLFCTEYCGTSHSDMNAKVVVHPAGEFDAWLEEASDFLSRMPPAEAGALLYRQRGCTQCHSVDGGAGIGPTFLGLFGSRDQLTDGTRVLVDEDYVRESILYPQAKLVAGYDPVMPTYKGRLKDEEITAIIEYLKTIR